MGLASPRLNGRLGTMCLDSATEIAADSVNHFVASINRSFGIYGVPSETLGNLKSQG